MVAYEVREVELSDPRLLEFCDTRRRFYFVRGEDGDNVLLHEGQLVAPIGEYLAVGDRISYAVGPSRFNAYYPDIRLECADVARAPRPDPPPDASSICAAVVLLGVLMAYDQYFKSK